MNNQEKQANANHLTQSWGLVRQGGTWIWEEKSYVYTKMPSGKMMCKSMDAWTALRDITPKGWAKAHCSLQRPTMPTYDEVRNDPRFISSTEALGQDNSEYECPIPNNPEDYMVGYWCDGTRCPMMVDVKTHLDLIAKTKDGISSGFLEEDDTAYGWCMAKKYAAKYRLWLDRNCDTTIENELSGDAPSGINKWECKAFIQGVLMVLIDNRHDFCQDLRNGTEFVPKSAIKPRTQD